jgi:hypothetical protein
MQPDAMCMAKMHERQACLKDLADCKRSELETHMKTDKRQECNIKKVGRELKEKQHANLDTS